MRLALVVLFSIGVSVVAGDVTSNDLRDEFQKYITKYNKPYTVDNVEKFTKFSVTYNKVQECNSHQGQLWSCGLNEFSDLSDAESDALLVTTPSPKPSNNRIDPNPDYCPPNSVPAAWDWRYNASGAPGGDCVLTPKNFVGNCSASWAYAAVAAIEGIQCINAKRLVSLSEQQVLDCQYNGGGDTCTYGSVEDGYNDVAEGPINAPYIDLASAYPNAGPPSTCKFNNATSAIGAFISGFMDGAKAGNETYMVNNLYRQPLSAFMDFTSWYKTYTGGVYAGTCSQTGNYYVEVVAYATTPQGVPYWVIRPNLGNSVAYGGYFWVYRGNNTCGIANNIAWPIQPTGLDGLDQQPPSPTPHGEL